MLKIIFPSDLRDIVSPKELFVTGTGTDVGKSYATGWLARELNRAGFDCITQKMIQTGNIGRSEDIELHRKIMGCGVLPEDEKQITFPVVLPYPCSPDLAARMENTEIDFNKIKEATETLSQNHEIVLIEGAGGLMVPLKGDYLTADYIKEHNLPILLVLSGELGSINHALLTLNAIISFGITLFAIIYNPFFDKDKIISEDTVRYLRNWINERFPHVYWIDMPVNKEI